MLLAAIWFWSAALQTGNQAMLLSLAIVFATMLQMSLLGALLTFAAKPLYFVHASTTLPWHLSPLEDQQLGGLFIWVVGGVLTMVWAAASAAKYLMQDEASHLLHSSGANWEEGPLKPTVGNRSHGLSAI
jgi:putative membrane protein